MLALRQLAYPVDLPPVRRQLALHRATLGPRRENGMGWRGVPGWDSLRGVALVQRGPEDLVTFSGGTAGTEPGSACTLGTRFQIGSVSKQFTAAAVLSLADQGVLSVDDRVGRWIGGCPASWDALTVHHLLTHTAGLPHWWDISGLDPTVPLTAEDELRIFSDAPLLSAPGERFHYSSPGYVLLARIVERAAEQPYASFLATTIFEPFGMASTFAGSGNGRPSGLTWTLRNFADDSMAMP